MMRTHGLLQFEHLRVVYPGATDDTYPGLHYAPAGYGRWESFKSNPDSQVAIRLDAFNDSQSSDDNLRRFKREYPSIIIRLCLNGEPLWQWVGEERGESDLGLPGLPRLSSGTGRGRGRKEGSNNVHDGRPGAHVLLQPARAGHRHLSGQPQLRRFDQRPRTTSPSTFRARSWWRRSSTADSDPAGT